MTTTDPTKPHICTADGADIIRDLRRQLVQEHEAAEWRQKCIDEAIAAIHDAPQEIAPLLPPVAPADLPRAVRALIDRARSQLAEARAALRQAEQERDEARREWRGLIDRIRTDASARGLDIEPGEDLVDGLLRIIDDRGKDRDDWQRQAEAADSLRAEVERHAGAQCGCDTNGECLARLYQQAHALVATAPETAPESPHTADPAPEKAEASTDHLGDADGAVAYWRAEISLADLRYAEAGRLRAEIDRLRADDLAIRRILRDYGASVGGDDPLPAVVAEALVQAETERDEARDRLHLLIDEVWRHGAPAMDYETERSDPLVNALAEVKRLSARVREWEAVNADLAERCDSGDIPIRLGERYSLAVLREIDRLRTERDRLRRRLGDVLDLEELPEDHTIVAAVRRLRAARSATPDTKETR